CLSEPVPQPENASMNIPSLFESVAVGLLCIGISAEAFGQAPATVPNDERPPTPRPAAATTVNDEAPTKVMPVPQAPTKVMPVPQAPTEEVGQVIRQNRASFDAFDTGSLGDATLEMIPFVVFRVLQELEPEVFGDSALASFGFFERT